MEVMKKIHKEMKRRNTIIQEAVDQEKDIAETEKMYMAV